MTVELFSANRAQTTVTSGGNDAPAAGTQETWTVASSGMFPAASSTALPATQFHVADTVAPSEIIAVTNVAGTTWTVTRGAESTTPVAHSAGFTVYQVVTTGFLGSTSVLSAAPGATPGNVLTVSAAGAAGWAPNGLLGDAAQKIAFPTYIYPTWYDSGGGTWATIMSASPQVPLVIINPASGPGTAVNSDYLTQTMLAQASGQTVIGYINTAYTATPAGTVEAYMGNYLSWYGVNGFFLDNALNVAGSAGYYVNLYSYAKQVTSDAAVVVINPGTPTDVSYMAGCDIVVNAEYDIGTYRVRSAAAWERDYPADRFWHIIYGCQNTNQRNEALYLSRQNRAGYVFVTDGILPNPYDILPGSNTGGGLPYWQGEVAQVTSPYPSGAWSPVLEDGFAAGLINTQWTVAGTAVSAATYALVILGNVTFGNYLYSTNSFNFTGMAASVQAVSVPAATTGEAVLRVQASSTNYVDMYSAGAATINFRYTTGGTASSTSTTYNATSMAWWRIVYSAGVMYWQTSPDDATWTTQRTVTSGLPTLTSASYYLLAGHTSGGDPDQNATFNNALAVSFPQPSDQQILTSGATIITTGMTDARVTAGSALTGMVLQAGTAGTAVTVINESANPIAFAASGSSNVADGTADTIPALVARAFTYDGNTSLWYRAG